MIKYKSCKKQLKTFSDVGGVKIGNENFSIIIPNGQGDGETKIVIIEKKEVDRSSFNYFTSIEGNFNIYKYDCGDKVCYTLEGRYGTYYKDGIVIFEKWE